MKPPASLSVTVVGNGRPGTPKSLLLDSGTTRYLINCGEGTQKILTEHKWDYFAALMVVDRRLLEFNMFSSRRCHGITFLAY